MHIDRTIPEIVRFARMHSVEQLLATRQLVFVSSQNHQDVKLRIRELDRLTVQLQQPTFKVNDQIANFEDLLRALYIVAVAAQMKFQPGDQRHRPHRLG